MILSMNDQEFAITGIDELGACLATVRDRQYWELSIGVYDDPGEGNGFFGLVVLVNGKRALLSYSQHLGDSGFTSADPTYSGSPAVMLDFQLSNGQCDKHPMAWTVPTEEALRAMEYAFLHQAPDPRITWKEWGDEPTADGFDLPGAEGKK